MDIHTIVYAFISAFLALFPPINPISDGLIVNRYLIGLNEKERKQVVMQITRNCMLVGITSIVLGHFILELFNLAIPVIQFCGGILICKTGLEGLAESGENNISENTNTSQNAKSLAIIQREIFYPLSFPICLGPGTISVIFTLMANSSSKKDDWLAICIDYGIIILAVIILCAMIYICSIQGQRLIQRLGTSGSMVITKLVSFLTFCIGMQIAITGISKIFHLSIL